MKHHYFALVFFSFISSFGLAQSPILCSEIKEALYFKDIPTVTNNNNGTISLTHLEQSVTDIFAKYEVFDFYEVNTSRKWYAITFSNKDLINELSENISDEIISIVNGYIGYNNYTVSPINPEFIEFVDGKKFNITQSLLYWSDGDERIKENVPLGFDLKVEFNYNSDDDSLIMQNVGETPCGNSFSIIIKGTTDNNLILWKIDSAIPNSNTETFCEIEHALYSILQISCNDYNDGTIRSFFNTENNVLQLSTSTPPFGFLEITFEEETLSTESYFINNLKFYETKNSPYLQVENIQNKKIYIEITSINGKTLHTKRILKNNDVDITALSSGIYFIKVYTPLSNQIKVFKFLKQ